MELLQVRAGCLVKGELKVWELRLEAGPLGVEKHWQGTRELLPVPLSLVPNHGCYI